MIKKKHIKVNFFNKKMIAVPVFFFFLCCSIFSQKINDYEKDLADSILKYYEVDSLKTLDFTKKFITESKKDKNPKNTFRGYHMLVMFYYKHYNEAKIVRYTDSLLSVAKKNNLKIELLKGYHLQNNNLKGTFGYDDERIFNNIFKAIDLSKEINSEVWECKFRQDISQYYMHTKQFDNSLLHYKDNLSKLKNLQNSADYKEFNIWGVNLESTYLSIAEVYIQLKKLDSAKLYNAHAKSILDTLNTGYHELYKYKHMINQLEVNLLENKPNLAKEQLNKALAIIPDYFRSSTKNFSKFYYSGMINYNQENYEKAIGYLEAIDTVLLQTDEELGFFQDELYKTLYKSYCKVNNLEKADYYFDKHLSAMEGQMAINNSANTNFNKIKTENYTAELDILKTQQKKQKHIILLVSALFLLIIFGIVILYRKIEKKDKYKLELLLVKISEKEKVASKPKRTITKIKDLEIQRIITKLEELEIKNYFLRIDCTASNLAKKIKTNTTYLSKIINSYYQKNFTEYINDLRIDYALNKLKNDKLFRQYSILSIANEIGFKSKESFNSAFKKRTGVLPSNLIRALNDKE